MILSAGHQHLRLYSGPLHTYRHALVKGSCNPFRSIRHKQVVARAVLGLDGEVFSGVKLVGEMGLLSVYGLSIVRSLLPALDARPQLQQQRLADAEEEESIGVRWGVMSVISFLPLFDWLVRFQRLL